MFSEIQKCTNPNNSCLTSVKSLFFFLKRVNILLFMVSGVPKRLQEGSESRKNVEL